MTMTSHASGHRIDDGRWQCKCGAIVPSGADWRDHYDASQPKTDPPGTCHLVGCPHKGQHPPHTLIGAGSWDDYTTPTHCLGFPVVTAGDVLVHITCSLGEQHWSAAPRVSLDPAALAALVDQHRAECTNRSARG